VACVLRPGLLLFPSACVLWTCGHTVALMPAVMACCIPDRTAQHRNVGVLGPAVSQVEISLQPWLAFKPDGVILFSDILTPLTGMNIPFDITAGKGPVIADPIRTMEVSSRCSNTSESSSITHSPQYSREGRRVMEQASLASHDSLLW